MVIGLDIDGTITAKPEFFAVLSQGLRREGCRIVIITFRVDREAAASYLAQVGVEYDELVTAPEGEISDPLTWKADMCASRGVSLLVDDEPTAFGALPRTIVGLEVRVQSEDGR